MTIPTFIVLAILYTIGAAIVTIIVKAAMDEEKIIWQRLVVALVIVTGLIIFVHTTTIGTAVVGLSMLGFVVIGIVRYLFFK